MYQSHGPQLAPAEAPSVGPFGRSVRDAVRVARQAKDLTPAERQLLDDLSRSEERYQYRTLERLTAILARVENVVLRESFPEGVLAAIAAHGRDAEAPSLRDALLTETAAVADADRAQHEAALDPAPSLSVIERAIATTTQQIAASRQFLRTLSRIRFERLHGRHA